MTFDWSSITGILALINIGLVVVTLVWVLSVKREPTSAVAWCLLVVLLPILGILFFAVFGYQSIHAPLRQKRKPSD